MIAINQIGFRPDDPKWAIAPGDLSGQPFAVVNEQGVTMLTGVFGPVMDDEPTNSRVCRADLTPLTAPGHYHVTVTDGETSAPFEIGAHVYDAIFRASLRMLYMQRCGCELPPEKAGIWAHPACHDTPARIWETERFLNVSGGWHDAGDYGRYVVPGVKTIADLFLLHEIAGDRSLVAADDLDIPESGNGIPDLLDEARYELEWMLKMQDEVTGGVYHKVTCRTFPGGVMPEDEREELVLSPISDAATADFAAIMAKSATVYQPYDAHFAAVCRAAAKRAWACLMSKTEWTGFTNPDGIRTGSYSDAHVADEIFYAAAELEACGEADADTARIIAENLAQTQPCGFGWADMSGYALYSLASRGHTHARDLLLERAEKVLTSIAADGYECSLGKWYIWGSNMVIANNGMLLLLCDHLHPDVRYHHAAHRQLDILLGANGLNTCFVSGFGMNPMQAPHHRPFMARGRAVPGMLAGGPNMHIQDACAKAALSGKPPALCYIDDWRSYSTNEIAIYWNSPLIFLIGAI